MKWLIAVSNIKASGEFGQFDLGEFRIESEMNQSEMQAQLQAYTVMFKDLGDHFIKELGLKEKMNDASCSSE